MHTQERQVNSDLGPSEGIESLLDILAFLTPHRPPQSEAVSDARVRDIPHSSDSLEARRINSAFLREHIFADMNEFHQPKDHRCGIDSRSGVDYVDRLVELQVECISRPLGQVRPTAASVRTSHSMLNALSLTQDGLTWTL